MPRRAFVADLSKAVQGVTIAGISDVHVGGDDGEFTFMCVADGQELHISVLIPELSDYPTSHMCIIFAPDNAPARLASLLNHISDAATGKTVPQILELVSSRLESTDHDGDQQMLDSQQLCDSDEDDEYEEEYFPGDEDMMPPSLVDSSNGSVPGGRCTEATDTFKSRIRRDLRAAKDEGFKVGHLGCLMDGLACYVSLSVRIAKLGISEEAMQAWQVAPTEYLVVIFHYPAGYKNMDDMKSHDNMAARRNFGIRLGICTTYKPTMQEAIQAFTVLSKDEENRREASQANESQQTTTYPKGFRTSFISRPLNELLEQRLHMLLKYRYSGMPWSGAETFYNNQILRPSDTKHTEGSDDKYYQPEHVSTTYPSLVAADHIQDAKTSEHSLPLVCTQFVLRHFVRCTEFCLICFSKMPDDLQAIKPYVCDNPLCLYQYMSLGFGPSIEHEILSQPKVVDLLISFCYASARVGRLRDFPTGLSLAVPHPVSNEGYAIPEYRGYIAPQALPPPPSTFTAMKKDAIKARYNAATNELLFDDTNQGCPITNAQWIVLRTAIAPEKAMHCRVIDASLFPSVRLSSPIIPTASELQAHYPPSVNPHASVKTGQDPRPPANEFRPASFFIYNQNFDDLSDAHKRQAVSALIDMLPPVQDMKNFLIRKAQSPLSAWVDRFPTAVLGLLRWIIASNRACIVQVENEDDAANGRKAEDRLYGMPGWVQFRFAMGAPDKERRFIRAVRDTSTRLNLKYPTLFAWHGSPMQNWHSIIREGLHFNETLNGRAFGHGVYHALDVGTSMGYSMLGGATWSNSDLKVAQALALNEVVNAPAEFTSRTPHLVVAQLDWIQTRYLFVKTMAASAGNTVSADTGTKPHDYLEQDPKMTPRGVSDSLVIPIHAISGSRRPKPKTTTKNKRQKATSGSQYNPIEIEDDDDDSASVATLEEDRLIFEDDDVHVLDHNPLPTPNSVAGDKGKERIGGFVSNMFGGKATPAHPLTDYVPGTLDYSSLPMLQMPAWATSGATKRLMKDFKDLIAVQDSTPSHELGWHVDEDKMDNMYQWIVELHSFESTLPLAQDMKKANLKSVVLELRFGRDYPMSPPFVRVIRPRFLGFAQGGGGHVTAGGAMCMQLLTNDGWSAVSSMESVLLQVRMAISSLEPKPARLERSGRIDYGVAEAVEAYTRACAVHGWTVPPGFREMAYGGTPTGHPYNPL
ncbi:hypothetical protein ACEQ8H_006204 [Pleosporales sp. CAS-2024a]